MVMMMRGRRLRQLSGLSDDDDDDDDDEDDGKSIQLVIKRGSCSV